MRLHVKLWNEQNSEKNIPSLSVIQTVGRNPNGPQYDQNSTEWNEEQEEFARRETYKLHEKSTEMMYTINIGASFHVMGARKQRSIFSLTHSVLSAIHLDLAIFA